jgi:hypothetical protein
VSDSVITFTRGEVSTYYAGRLPHLKQRARVEWRTACPTHGGHWFGRSKGQPLSTLTDQYIKRLLAQDLVTADMKAAVKTEQDRRARTATPSANISATSVSDDIALEIGCAVIAALRAKGVTL